MGSNVDPYLRDAHCPAYGAGSLALSMQVASTVPGCATLSGWAVGRVGWWAGGRMGGCVGGWVGGRRAGRVGAGGGKMPAAYV
jgi:hypothetical protein